MDRRAFLSSTVALAAASAAAESQSESEPKGHRQYIELRLYTFGSQLTQDRFAAFLKDAFVPAAQKAGITNVGAFVVADKPEALSIYLLLTHPSLGAYGSAENRMLQDEHFLSSGASVLNLPAEDPPYLHAEISLLEAFESWPKLKPPKETASNEQRVFELRTYESHSRKANKKKIEMFNNGEAGIFARCGFQPVFFGETLAGPQIPNLTYMVTYPSIESRDGFWKAFGADPEKARLWAIPEYADKLIVSKIHSTFLKPLPGSLI